MKMNKKELTFLGIGILMLIIVILSVILSIGFLVKNINLIFGKQAVEPPSAALEFQIEKAELLRK